MARVGQITEVASSIGLVVSYEHDILSTSMDDDRFVAIRKHVAERSQHVVRKCDLTACCKNILTTVVPLQLGR